MSLRFRLRGLAETFLEEVSCPCCGNKGRDDQFFSTEMTRVTFDGIVVIVQCRLCAEIFIPNNQRMGIVSQKALKEAVEKDLRLTGEKQFSTYQLAAEAVQQLNAEKKGQVL
jgi:hypothetical protein